MPAPPNMRRTVTGRNGVNSSRMNSGSKRRHSAGVIQATVARIERPQNLDAGLLRQGRRLAWRDRMRSIREPVRRLRRNRAKAESSIRTSPMNPICRRPAARQLFIHAAAVFLALVASPLAAQAKDKLLDETAGLAGTILFVETKVPALVIGVVRNHETAV